MDVILGLDVSSSVIGWSIIENITHAAPFMKPIMWGHIDLRNEKGGFWAKVDVMEHEMSRVISSIHYGGHSITKLMIEDPVEKFKRGSSSAHTIALLARFNALVSQHVRRETGLLPLYVDATAARRAIGVPLLSKKKSGGIDHKQQTFTFLCETVFSGVVWPLNRAGNIEIWNFDRVDSYVICLAGCLGLGEPY
jgi:hypothetical protein